MNETKRHGSAHSASAADTRQDPVDTDPDKYRTILENDDVRVLEYHDTPGNKTSPHHHPDSVMYTLSSFKRRLHFSDGRRDVSMETGQVFWLPAQIHSGENIGDTDTRVLFVELKNSSAPPRRDAGAAPVVVP
ncbi:MAG: cupin domain-containing protein [Cryobacterium sp.]|nr:cupin domain-containing protein [Cryobacterium sp.]HNP15161.1 cupin domain-containing protein [Terrimesophilobacter sp.]